MHPHRDSMHCMGDSSGLTRLLPGWRSQVIAALCEAVQPMLAVKSQVHPPPTTPLCLYGVSYRKGVGAILCLDAPVYIWGVQVHMVYLTARGDGWCACRS